MPNMKGIQLASAGALHRALSSISGLRMASSRGSSGQEHPGGPGNDFTGFDAEGKVIRISDVLAWLQRAIHERYSMSKYDVERLGGVFTPQMAEIP